MQLIYPSTLKEIRFNLYTIIAYLKFLVKSTNEHGVHSPFVFDFVTKGLYQKKKIKTLFDKYAALKTLSKKEKKVLSKILNYFKIHTINFDVSNFSKATKKEYKILYINNLNSFSKINLEKLNSKHIILVDGIYANKQSYLTWQKVIQNKEITVSINLFYFGLVFFRKEQAKEHFKIRV